MIPHPRDGDDRARLLDDSAARSLVFGPRLRKFFRQTRTSGADRLGVPRVREALLRHAADDHSGERLPALTARRHIVEASCRARRVQERGAWRTHTMAALEAGDIFDVDVSTRESAVAATRRGRRAEDDGSGPRCSSGDQPAAGAPVGDGRGDGRKGRGVIVKTRHGLTSLRAGSGRRGDPLFALGGEPRAPDARQPGLKTRGRHSRRVQEDRLCVRPSCQTWPPPQPSRRRR